MSPLEKDATMSTQVMSEANSGPERWSEDKPAKQKFGLVLQGGGALGAYEVGAVEYLYERGMECAIVTGASAGAMNAAALAGATQYPPRVLQELWEKLAVDPPIRSCPRFRSRPGPSGDPAMALLHTVAPGAGHVLAVPDVRNLPDPTYIAKPTMGKTLEALVDLESGTRTGDMRLTVWASGVEDGTVATSPTAGQAPAGAGDEAVRFGIEHVLASGSFLGGFLVDHDPEPGLLGRRPHRQAPRSSDPRQPDRGRGGLDADLHDRRQRGRRAAACQHVRGIATHAGAAVDNRLRSDLDTATSYTRAPSASEQVG